MEWIKCSHRLPEPNSKLLAYAKDAFSDHYTIISAVYYDKFEMKGGKPKYEFHEYCHCSGMEWDYMMIEDVTHWMPLPEPPNEPKK